MQSLVLTGKVQGGILPKAVYSQLAEAVGKMEGKTLELTLKERTRRRSSNQNAFYWGVVVQVVMDMFREAGNYVDKDDVHEFLKLRVGKLSRMIVTPDGQVHKSLGSTTKLSTMEFENYLTQVRAWAAEFGCEIPLPNEELEAR